MDKYELRRQNLAALLHRHCGGRAATLADLIDRSPSYVSRMLYPEGKAGKKRIGEDMRDLIEDALGLPRGTLDIDPNAQGSQAVPQPTAAAANQEVFATKVAPSAAPTETTLERLDQAEKALVDLFRRSTDEGKTVIQRIATTVEKIDD